MECSKQGTERNTRIYGKTGIHHQEEEIGQEQKAKESFNGRKWPQKAKTIPKKRTVKPTTGAQSTKCGPFTNQANSH